MSKSVKIVLAIVSAVIIIFLAVTACRIVYPKYNITRGFVSSPSRPDYTGQNILVWHDPGIVPKDSSRAKNANLIQEWIFEVNDELRTYQAPYNITVSGEVLGGKTTLRYEGIVTTQAGETVNYLNEKAFDFVLTKNLFSQSGVVVPAPYVSVIIAAVAFIVVAALIILLFVKRKSIFAAVHKLKT